MVSNEELDVKVNALLSKRITKIPTVNPDKPKLNIGIGTGIGLQLNKPVCPIHKIEMTYDPDLGKWSCQELQLDGAICPKVATHIEKKITEVPTETKVSKYDVLVYREPNGEYYLRQGDVFIRLPLGTQYVSYPNKQGVHTTFVGTLEIPIKHNIIEKK